jgi:glycosyltransferase involved in cell wall biosynthesis
MHIGIVCEYFPHINENGIAERITGGAEASSYYLAKYLSKNHKVTIIATRLPLCPDWTRYKNITIVRVGKVYGYTQSGKFYNRYFLISESSHLLSCISDLDIVECYTWFSYAVRLPKHVPCVIAYHDTWLGRWISWFGITGIIYEIAERWIQKRPWDAFITRTNFMKSKLTKLGINENKIYVVPDGVELESIPQIKEKFSKPTICYIGRLVQYKNVDVLLKAIQIVKRTIPDIQCKIIGAGPLRDNLEKLTYQLGIKENVEFMGNVMFHEEVFEILKKSHIFCLPSITEGFGIVILESMACGVPYICSNIPTLIEVTQNGKGGMLFKQGDENDLAEKIKYLLKDKEFYTKCIDEGTNYVKQFEWKNIAKKMEEVYTEIITRYKNKNL